MTGVQTCALPIYIIQLRNIIVHGYAVVENVTIWGIVQADVPDLCARVKAMLAGD